MIDEQIALARRAVACPKWRWMPGMKITTGLRLSESLVPFTFPVDLPDLSDPATIGCLLALVREAYADLRLVVRWDVVSRRWETVSRYRLYGDAESEAEALVAALEAATDGR